MCGDKLTSFLSDVPTGAICLTDPDGELLALPARILSPEDDLLEVEIDGLDVSPAQGTPACVVADRFPSYEAIRGIITQGAILAAAQSKPSRPIVAVAAARTITFSFANVTT
ncbi:hypothetical protein [Mycobacterium paraintracellulare]|uniref:hypothetical protein n=1 Tax=Mycobacterium paraintracellulare TaxID=1138383 RepID=UPI001929735D|nr:hypothetical protein [Mycobacterium paraintracellulare]BCP05400.1 hypothetical protein MINTM019_28560 [Mycobacterium paraintracellulare]